MSTVSAPVEAPVLTPPQERRLRRPVLRLVLSPVRRAPRAPFIAVLIVVLGGGLVTLLFVNTLRQQASFRLAALQSSDNGLSDQEQALAREVEIDTEPSTLQARAAALGMVPQILPGFVNDRGQILGPVPSGAPIPSVGSSAVDGIVVAGTPTPVSSPSPSTSVSPSTHPSTKPTKATSKPTTRPTTSPATRPTVTPSTRPTTGVSPSPRAAR